MGFDITTAKEVGGFDLMSAKPVEEEDTLDQIGRSFRTAFAGAGNAADTGITMATSGVAGMFGGDQEKRFKKLNERVASRDAFANPDQLGELPLSTSLIGTIGILPISIIGGLLDAGASAGKRAIDLGESVQTAGKIAGIGTLSAMVSAAIPIAGKSFEWWRRAAQGAFGNTIQTYATKILQRAQAETAEGKKEFTPTVRELAEASIIGAGFGVGVKGKPNPKELKQIESRLKALDEMSKETPSSQVPPASVVPEQLPLPFTMGPEAIAERRAIGTGQPDFFFSDQANMAAMGDGAIAEAQARSRTAQVAVDASQQEAAQRALMARQQALEAEVASRVGEEQIARQRAATLAQGADALQRTDSGYEQFLAQREAEAGVEAGRRPLLQHQDVLDFTPHGDRPTQFGMTDIGGRIDEHGIPIRADLSMEAQNIQNPLQRNLWGDELPGKTGDGGKALTRALDSMPPGPEREAAIASMKPQGVGVGGPRGAQRGAIDIRGVKEALDQFEKGFIRGPDALRAFVGTFDPDLRHDDTKTRGGGHIGWGPAIDGSRLPSSQGRLVWMSPDAFHDAAMPRHVSAFKKTGIGEDKRTGIREGITSPEGLSSIPVLRVQDGKVVGHEGRHRMDVMRQLGIKKVPVYLYTEGHRNSDGPLAARFLVSEDGRQNIAVPESIFPMGTDQLGFAPKTPVGQSGLGRGGLTRGGTDFGIADILKKNFKEVDDIVKAVQTAKAPAAKDIIESALKAGKDEIGSRINNFTDLVETGGTMTAAKRRSPLIEGVVRTKGHFLAAAERAIRDTVFPFEKAVRHMRRTEVVEMAALLKKEMLSGQEYSVKAMADAGFSQRQLLAYQKLRQMHNVAWEEQNSLRVAAGEKPLTKMEAYLNSQWQGIHRQFLRDKDGRTRWLVAADSLPRMNADAAKILKQFPDLVADKPFTAQKSVGGQDIQQIYATMLKIMGDDPAFRKIKDWYESETMKEASGALGQERFFERKYKVRGFVGDRPLTGLRSDFSEALAMLQTQANYAKSAHKWSALQKTATALKDVFSNKDLQEQQPNNMAYAKKYLMHQFGADEAKWVKAMEDSLNDAIPFGATSTNQISRGIKNLKAFWTASKIGVNLGYAAANVLQLPQALPYMTDIQVKYGGDPVTALAVGTTFGGALVAHHQLNPLGLPVHGMLTGIPHKEMRTFLAQAMKYAEDNQVILSSAADEAPIAKSFGAVAAVKRGIDKTISLPDSLRAIAYMTFATQLHSTGKFSTMDALRLAHEYTTRSMVDFREGERAMIFSKMGMAGDAANTLQSYSVNYFQQWNWAMREAINKNPLPALVMLGVQGAIGGALGLPFFNTVNKTLEWLKDVVKETAPAVWKKIRDFSLSDLILKMGGERMLYGVASKNPLDVSVASRVQAPGIEEMVQIPFAPAADIAKTALSVGKAALDPTDKQKVAQALYNVTPSGVQGYLETGPLKDFVSVPREGGRVVARPRDMSDPTGMFFRSDSDAAVRQWGMRSQTETFARDQGYKAAKRLQDSRDVLADLPKKIYNASRKNDADLKELVSLYVELTPGLKTPKDTQAALQKMFETQITRQFTTSPERLATGSTIESALAYKRFKQAMKDAGYSE